MAHVTTFWFKAAPGKRQEVIDIFARWDTERRTKAKGFQRSILVSNSKDPDEFFVTVEFDSRENYDANSNDPEQDAWYRQLRGNLVEDPGWFDGKLEAAFAA